MIAIVLTEKPVKASVARRARGCACVRVAGSPSDDLGIHCPGSNVAPIRCSIGTKPTRWKRQTTMRQPLNVVHPRVLRGIVWSVAVSPTPRRFNVKELSLEISRELASSHQALAIVDHLTEWLVPERCVPAPRGTASRLTVNNQKEFAGPEMCAATFTEHVREDQTPTLHVAGVRHGGVPRAEVCAQCRFA
jgi:hypothetical protein